MVFSYCAQPLQDGEGPCLCVVTGGASGIGRATVLRLEELGWHVLAADFNEKALEELDAQTSSRVATVVCDVSSAEACEDVRNRAEEMMKSIGAEGIAGLANIAGLMQSCPVMSVNDDQLKRIIAINCEAPVRFTRLLMPLLLKAKRPTVCNVASIAADTAFPWTGAYSATKGFVAQFSEALRREAMANNLNLRVAVIKPGYIATPMTAGTGAAGIRWCDQNPNTPFTPALRASSEKKDFIEKTGRVPGFLGKVLALIGNPDNLMKTTPEHVTEEIVHSLTVKSPAGCYFTASLAFKLLIWFMALMPRGLRDLMIAKMF
jgi:NAD(P)-dependent dehydrogenase (short-subunit alcohol dehydrogenase family)